MSLMSQGRRTRSQMHCQDIPGLSLQCWHSTEKEIQETEELEVDVVASIWGVVLFCEQICELSGDWGLVWWSWTLPSISRGGWWSRLQGDQRHWPTCTEHIRARQTCWSGQRSLCGGLG